MDAATQVVAQTLAIDVNSDLGEGFALPPLGLDLEVIKAIAVPATGQRFHPRHSIPRHDAAVMAVASSLNLACGLHSGDAVVLNRVIPEALERGIHLGAHPSYPDVFGFGQKRMAMSPTDLEAVLLYQLGALAGVLSRFDARLRHVKCHGALQFDISYDETICDTLASAVEIFDRSLVVVVIAGSPMVERLRRRGIRVASELPMDRGYGADGRLLPRTHPKALLDSPEKAVARLISAISTGRIEAEDGTALTLRPDSCCIHSDTPDADRFAAAVKRGLGRAGIAIRPMSEIVDA